MNKLKNLYLKSGWLLFIFRLPLRIIITVLNKLNTLFWKMFLHYSGKNILIEFGVSIENPKQISLGNNVYIGKGTIIGSENLSGRLIVDDGVHICRNCQIDHSGNIHLKSNVLLSEYVQIFSHSHGYDPRSIPVCHDLIIEQNCWIGNNTIILENAKRIEKKIIVGAGSIVTKPCVQEKSLYTGIPAVYKKSLV